MDGRAFLDVAQRLLQASTEADWRSAAGRAYYALMLEGRAALQRWGFTIPRTEQIHRFVRLHLLYAGDTDMGRVSQVLEELSKLRNQADYQIELLGRFASNQDTKQGLADARAALLLLDAVSSDAARRNAIITAMRKAFP